MFLGEDVKISDFSETDSAPIFRVLLMAGYNQDR
jgi:hypothetical protein